MRAQTAISHHTQGKNNVMIPSTQLRLGPDASWSRPVSVGLGSADDGKSSLSPGRGPRRYLLGPWPQCWSQRLKTQPPDVSVGGRAQQSATLT